MIPGSEPGGHADMARWPDTQGRGEIAPRVRRLVLLFSGALLLLTPGCGSGTGGAPGLSGTREREIRDLVVSIVEAAKVRPDQSSAGLAAAKAINSFGLSEHNRVNVIMFMSGWRSYKIVSVTLEDHKSAKVIVHFEHDATRKKGATSSSWLFRVSTEEDGSHRVWFTERADRK